MASKFHPINVFKYFLLAVFALFSIAAVFYGWTSADTKEDGEEQATPYSCTRTTRLENPPNYDRALSLINEKYEMWEEINNENLVFGRDYFFPSSLVNCIKILETDSRESEEAEGYFVFNSDEIKENYFPIYVDASYSEADDPVTALLLVHEITHVQQLLDALSGKESSCIDMETEAHYASFNFYGIQSGENRKALDLRIDYDEDLHPQLQMIKTLKEMYGSELDRLMMCYENEITDTCGEHIDNEKKTMLRDLISEDEYYRQQCELEE